MIKTSLGVTSMHMPSRSPGFLSLRHHPNVLEQAFALHKKTYLNQSDNACDCTTSLHEQVTELAWQWQAREADASKAIKVSRGLNSRRCSLVLALMPLISSMRGHRDVR